jgi:hypothetical protein
VALDGIIGAYVDWEDSKGLNEWEHKALELSEERSKLAKIPPLGVRPLALRNA